MKNRLPPNIKKYRLALPPMEPIINDLFERLYIQGELMDPTLASKTVDRLIYEVEEFGLPEEFLLKSHPMIGYGVFNGNKTIRERRVLGIYTGKYVVGLQDGLVPKNSLYVYGIHQGIPLEKEEFNELKKCGFISSNSKKFCPESNYEITLDAEKEGNWTRFINHSDRANCWVELRKIVVSAHSHIVVPVVITKRSIKPGTQLTVNYGKSYWETCGIVKQHVKGNWTQLPDTFR